MDMNDIIVSFRDWKSKLRTIIATRQERGLSGQNVAHGASQGVREDRNEQVRQVCGPTTE